MAGVEHKIRENFESGKHLRTVHLREGYTKVGGYSYFCTDFDFDEDGKLLEVGAYE
jgi:hypothetical protein